MSTNKNNLHFIDDYCSHKALWDINDKNYTNKQIRTDVLQALANEYTLNIVGVKNK